eukprot:2340912-Rhodomonas_salina.1
MDKPCHSDPNLPSRRLGVTQAESPGLVIPMYSLTAEKSREFSTIVARAYTVSQCDRDRS